MPPTENSAALFGWHSQDSRATGPLDTADTVTAHYGTGGGNTPLIVQPCICIQGSMIGRAEKNGPQGDGLNQEVCFTLNTVDEHAVAYTFAEQNYSEYVLSPAGGTIKANGGATGGGGETLVAHNQPHYIVRRLMPMPSCRMCNHYKRAHDLETFRRYITEIPRKLQENYIFKIGVVYGNVLPNAKGIKFYFERVRDNHAAD